MLTVFMMLLLSAANQSANRVVMWGINGHPLTQKDYSYSTWEDQFRYLKDLGLESYRFDVLLNSEGFVKNEKQFLELIKKLKNEGISPFPVLMQSGFNTKDTIEIYKLSYYQGRNFARRYGDDFQYIEVGNEEDNKMILSNKVDGTKKAHYDKKIASKILAELKGFIDGIKAIKPSTNISVSFSWVHFYYLELLKQRKIDYDIIGVHWYSSMGDITRVQAPYGNVLKKISTTYNKPVWITEFNYFMGTYKTDFITQNKYVTTRLHRILEQNIADRIYIYELFDQPALFKRIPKEAFSGILFKDSASNSYVKKVLYNNLKQIVSDNKQTAASTGRE